MANPTGVYETIANTRTVRIDSDLSGKEGYLVTNDTTDDGVVNLAANAAASLHVLIEGVDGSNEEGVGTVALTGSVVKVKAGGAITAGAKITANASGEGIVTTTDTDNYAGIAKENAASGDLFLMEVVPGMVAA